MPSVEFLADTSVFARLSKPVVAARFAPLAATARVGICAPVAFEIGYSARSHHDFVAVTGRSTSKRHWPVEASNARCRWWMRSWRRSPKRADSGCCTTTATSNWSPRSLGNHTSGSCREVPLTDARGAPANAPYVSLPAVGDA